MAQHGGIQDNTFVQAYLSAKVKQVAKIKEVITSKVSFDNCPTAFQTLFHTQKTQIMDLLKQELTNVLDNGRPIKSEEEKVSIGSFLKNSHETYPEGGHDFYPDGLSVAWVQGPPSILKKQIEKNDPELAKQVMEELNRQKQ